MGKHFGFLVLIAEKTGQFVMLKTSTLSLSKELGVPQQTISRKLKDMERIGLIKRQVSPKGIILSIKDEGRKLLQKNYEKLKEILGRENPITGTVEKGIGEGSYYVSQKGYQSQFKEKLGFIPFQGTLNVKVGEEALAQLLSKPQITIDGFYGGNRTFGSISCYKIKISSIDAVIVRPERASHPSDILEIIAPINLRNALKLKDKSKVKLK